MIIRCGIPLFILALFLHCSERPSRPAGDSRQEISIVKNGNVGKWNNSRNLTLKLILTIGDNDKESYTFGGVGRINVDEFGNIYVCDRLDHSIKVFDVEGRRLMTIGKAGQGPGELSGPMRIEFGPEGTIYVLEFLNKRVSIFNRQGGFLSSFGFNFGSVLDMAVDPDNGDVFLSELMGIRPGDDDSSKVVHKYERDGSPITSFRQPSIIGKTSIGINYSAHYLTLLPERNLLCFVNYPYELTIYGLSGIHKRTVTRDSPVFLEPQLYKRDEFQMLIPSASLSGCLLLEDGNLLIRILDFGQDVVEQFAKRKGKLYQMRYEYSYDLYDSGGRFLQSFADPLEGMSISFVDSRGFAYAAGSPEGWPQVSKYEISLEMNPKP